MVKCKDCANLKKKYIPAWSEYIFRCKQIPTMPDMASEDIEEDNECEFFIKRIKEKKE